MKHFPSFSNFLNEADKKLPSWMSAEDKALLDKGLENFKGDLKVGFDVPKQKGHNPSHMRFTYGRHQNMKEQAVENAKDLLEAVWMFRAKNKPTGIFDEDYFSADRLTDPNVGAMLHGISKIAKKLHDKGYEEVVENYFGKNIASRIKACDLYHALRRTALVGGSWDKPADLAKFTSLIQLKLK
jgi:hypothetical protein